MYLTWKQIRRKKKLKLMKISLYIEKENTIRKIPMYNYSIETLIIKSNKVLKL